MLLQQILSGISTGAIYALLGLALVVVFQATRHLNLAQGEMAMFSTFIAWQLLAWGVPYWPAFGLTVIISFLGGCLLQRGLMHPFRNASPLAQVGAMVGLFLILNSLAGAIWNHEIKGFPSPFGEGPAFGSTLISAHRAGMIAICLALVVVLTLFLRRSASGLLFRAAAENATSARLVGVRVDRFVMLGWGLAAAIGAVAGMLVAPVVFLEPNMMFQVLPFAFAAAVLGGVTSPIGAVVGGLLLGEFETLAAIHLPEIGRELKLAVALVAIAFVLVLRPQGLFGAKPGTRV